MAVAAAAAAAMPRAFFLNAHVSADFIKNIDTGDMFLSNIFINDKNSQNLLEELIKTNNMLVLKSTLRDILN